jgi:hypothetical protein
MRPDLPQPTHWLTLKRYAWGHPLLETEGLIIFREEKKRGRLDDTSQKCSPGASRLPLEVREPADWGCGREGLAYSSLDLLATVR